MHLNKVKGKYFLSSKPKLIKYYTNIAFIVNITRIMRLLVKYLFYVGNIYHEMPMLLKYFIYVARINYYVYNQISNPLLYFSISIRLKKVDKTF